MAIHQARQVRSKIKVMLTVFCDIRGIVHNECATEGQTVTKEYYQYVFCRLHDAIQCKRPHPWTAKNWQFHHDNGPAHSWHLIQTFLPEHGIPVIHQPLHSPDMAPCNIWLFSELKTILKGSSFQCREVIMQNMMLKMNTVPKEAFQECLAVEQSVS